MHENIIGNFYQYNIQTFKLLKPFLQQDSALNNIIIRIENIHKNFIHSEYNFLKIRTEFNLYFEPKQYYLGSDFEILNDCENNVMLKTFIFLIQVMPIYFFYQNCLLPSNF